MKHMAMARPLTPSMYEGPYMRRHFEMLCGNCKKDAEEKTEICEKCRRKLDVG